MKALILSLQVKSNKARSNLSNPPNQSVKVKIKQLIKVMINIIISFLGHQGRLSFILFIVD